MKGGRSIVPGFANPASRLPRRAAWPQQVPRSHFSASDLAEEALAGVLARPLRTALTALGVVLGIATLVITLGVSETAGEQIIGRFDALEATSVTVNVPATGDDESDRHALVAWSGVDQVTRLNGVRAAAALAGPRGLANATITASDLHDPSASAELTFPVYAATVNLPAAASGRLVQGRFYDNGHVTRHDRVVVLGQQAAEALGITRLDNSPAIFVQGQPFTVIGIADFSRRETYLAAAVLMPSTTLADRFGAADVDRVLVSTALGAAQLIARQAPIALSPNDHDQLAVKQPADPQRARNGAKDDVNGMFLVLGLVSLVVGALGIANVTLVTVMERVGEIGLRRALGGARRHIAVQFLVESSAIGLLGGVVGAAVGIASVVGVALARDWTPVLDLRLAFGSPVVGSVVGLLSGAYPAYRAAQMEPVDALRSGT